MLLTLILVILSKKKEAAIWWELESVALQDEHRRYLLGRFPSLRDDHEDLINETHAALSKDIQRRRAALPQTWFKQEPPSKDERDRFHKLAMLILKRRVADLFRRRLTQPKFSPIDQATRKIADATAPSLDRQIMLRRLLEVTSSVLDEMRPEDRDLVAFIANEPSFRHALKPRERKRLQRLRSKLKSEIARQLGDEVADLLRITL